MANFFGGHVVWYLHPKFIEKVKCMLQLAGSSRISGGGLDSQGNPFVYDVGSVPGINSPFTTCELVCWAWQVAQGMDYLCSRKVYNFDFTVKTTF